MRIRTSARRFPRRHGPEYCLIEALGLGVRDCGTWSDAILQLLILCRGIVGEVVDCLGLNWTLAPRIIVGGFGSRDPWPVGGTVPAVVERKPFKYFMIPGVVFELDADGWRYAQSLARAPRRNEEPTPLSYRGPFRDPAEAARDFAETLGAQYGGITFSSLVQPESPMRDADMQAMLDALGEHMSPRFRAR